MQRPMDATDGKASVVIKIHQIVNETSSNSSPSNPATDHSKHKCNANEITEQIPLAANPSILLHVLSSYELEPNDLAALEAKLAALDTCCQKAMFKSMKHEEKEKLKQQCGGSWKLVLGYLLVGEKNYRREKSQVIAGPGHSIVVTTKGEVYSFGANSSGQLGLGNTEDQFKPCLIRSLQGIRITQAAVGSRRTMLVSDTGSVYTFGQDAFGGLESFGTYTSSPKLLESLKGIFVVQASIGGYFSAVLSREGQVYTFSWGRDERLGHRSDLTDVEPRLLSGPLENALVVQIAAGNCYLLMLVYQPTGMSVYSVGCGLGGKLGHGLERSLGIPKLIERFQVPNVKPLSISAGAFHCAVLALDGRVFTWGWSRHGCLGHDENDDDDEILPKAVEGLKDVRASHLSAGAHTTFVVTDNDDVYSFGWGRSLNLGVQADGAEKANVWTPKLATSIAALNEKVVQISATNTWDWIDQDCYSHTLVLTESVRLYSFGAGTKGQLGVKLVEGQKRSTPDRVDIDLA
ncbi:hypothetical protein SETIT_7G141800v2 [Setaria italica]|uniref:RCC1-like domain-containing protein n=1 Tax=Setaria italica TaxID=4555 RepID=A0A368RVM0_SETIT|nr:hypothetical protein SETIT_7G141800v2 [Setaria italica]